MQLTLIRFLHLNLFVLLLLSVVVVLVLLSFFLCRFAFPCTTIVLYFERNYY